MVDFCYDMRPWWAETWLEAVKLQSGQALLTVTIHIGRYNYLSAAIARVQDLNTTQRWRCQQRQEPRSKVCTVDRASAFPIDFIGYQFCTRYAGRPFLHDRYGQIS